jgi:hypothetical protein
MSKAVPNNQEDQEIDLSHVSKKNSNFLIRLSTSIFRIQFFYSWYNTGFCSGSCGFGLGLYLDKTQKKVMSILLLFSLILVVLYSKGRFDWIKK